MNIKITDDFDLEKIVYSGQCFRPAKLDDDSFRFITGSDVLYIKNVSENYFDISCDRDTWDNVWHKYFNLDIDYAAARASVPSDDKFMKNAAIHGAGIRILNQNHFETLISFIVSQRKSIPAIRKSIEMICDNFGEVVDTGRETLHLFPSAGDIVKKGFDALSTCSLGYRLAYITRTVEDVVSGTIDLNSLESADDATLLESLMTLHGVGIKVASCVALFSYNRGSIAPVDTWIKKVIDNEYSGIDPFPGYGKNSGIYQQYAFYSAIS